MAPPLRTPRSTRRCLALPHLRAAALGDEQVLALLRRSLGDERGIAGAPKVEDDALEFLAARSGGDARIALAALELACETVGTAR